MSDETILPCPHCGGNDIRFTDHGRIGRAPYHRGGAVWSMCCYDCGATFPNMYNMEGLVKCWNRRAARCNDTAPVAPIGDAKLDSMVNEAMPQAQVFASAWSMVGGPFDDGDALETAKVEKLALRALISDLLATVAAQGAK